MQTYAPLEASSCLPDARLERRLGRMLEQFTAQPQATIPQATENRNDMDATYAFFDNTKVNPSAILASCLPQTLTRLGDATRVLVLQDTSDHNFSTLEQTQELGYTDGSEVRGLLVHSSLAVRPDGLPIGLLTQQIWTRDPALKGLPKKRQRAAKDKESYRWLDHAAAVRAALPSGLTIVHVADREADTYDWLAAPRPSNAHLLIRVAQAHRVVVQCPDEKEGKLSEVIRAQVPLGDHVLEVPRGSDRVARQATVTIRIAEVKVPPPTKAKKRSKLPRVRVWVIEAFEANPPIGETGLLWRLVTTEEVRTLEEAIRALTDYATRWRIERFHYVLKQGCQVERLQLETADRLSNAIAVYSEVAVRVLRLTYLGRVGTDIPVATEFNADEVAVLDHCRQRQEKQPKARVKTIAEAIRVIARLGGHLGRKKDGPPGAKVLWRGLHRLHDRVLGYQINRAKVTGNTRNE